MSVKGDIVNLKLNCTIGSDIASGNWKEILTIPAAASPGSEIMDYVGAGTSLVVVKISTRGTVSVRPSITLAMNGAFAGNVIYTR